MAGYFGGGSGYQFTPLLPVRLFDTRSLYTELNQATGSATLSAGQVVHFTVAGTRVCRPTPRRRRSTSPAVDVGDSGFVTAYPCGALPTGRTSTSAHRHLRSPTVPS